MTQIHCYLPCKLYRQELNIVTYHVSYAGKSYNCYIPYKLCRQALHIVTYLVSYAGKSFSLLTTMSVTQVF